MGDAYLSLTSLSHHEGQSTAWTPAHQTQLKVLLRTPECTLQYCTPHLMLVAGFGPASNPSLNILLGKTTSALSDLSF